MGRFSDDWDDCDATSSRSTHETAYEWSESVSLAVVDAVAAVTGRRPTALPPLADCIETDALDALFGSPPDATTTRLLTFRYAGCTVTVGGDGCLSITLVEDGQGVAHTD
jgi:hypothetical protein